APPRNPPIGKPTARPQPEPPARLPKRTPIGQPPAQPQPHHPTRPPEPTPIAAAPVEGPRPFTAPAWVIGTAAVRGGRAGTLNVPARGESSGSVGGVWVVIRWQRECQAG